MDPDQQSKYAIHEAAREGRSTQITSPDVKTYVLRVA